MSTIRDNAGSVTDADQRNGRELGMRIARVTLLFFAFVVLMKPVPSYVLGYFGIVGISFKMDLLILSVVMVTVFVCAGVKVARERRADPFLIALTVLVGIVFVSSLLFPGEGEFGTIVRGELLPGPAVLSWYIDWMPLVSTVLIVYAFHADYPKDLVWSFFLACLCFLFFNFHLLGLQGISGFGKAENLFFGYRNVIFRVTIPAFACSLIIACGRSRIWALLPISVYLACLYQTLVAYSATSLCAFLAMGLLSVTMFWKGCRKFLNAATYGVAYIIAFVAIVILRLHNGLNSLLGPVFQKNFSTFTGRTYIWDAAFEHLQGSRLLTGYGMDSIYHVLDVNGRFFKHAHNEILNILLEGGVFALAALVVLFALSCSVLYKRRNAASSAAFAVGLAGFLVIALTEVGVCCGLFFLLSMSYYWSKPKQRDALVRQDKGSCG